MKEARYENNKKWKQPTEKQLGFQTLQTHK